MRIFMTGAAALTLVLTVSACGTSPGERALSGGALGAGAGAVGAALLDGNVGVGALLGGGLGAGAGFLTDPGSVNLGDPFWQY